MAGFIRRFGFFPAVEVIQQIEGVDIVDSPPPGSINGVGTGVACVVGEFADVTYGVSVDDNGNVTTKAQPVQIFSAQDMTNKVGGWDETLGEFGGDMGNGFVATRNKKFSALVIVPVNNASSKGIRMWRQLPTNKANNDPTPVVPVQAAQVLAGREFKSGANRARGAARVVFTSLDTRKTGIDGVVVPAGLPAPTQVFTSALGDFVNAGVAEGDAVVLDRSFVGVIATTITDNPLLIGAVTANVVSTDEYPASGFFQIDLEIISYAAKTATSFTGLVRGLFGTAAAAHVLASNVTLLNDANTYRVVSVGGATSLTLERQDGTNFTSTNWFAATALPYRVHQASDADTGANHQLSEEQGYRVPARPLDATIATATLLTPTVIPPVVTRSGADPLSGLTARTTTNAAGLIFVASVQTPNAPNAAAIDALYSTAIDSLLDEKDPGQTVNLLWAARKSTNIASKLKQHVLDASSRALTRTVQISPPLDTVSLATITGDVAPGVGSNRDERVDYSWPGVQTFVPEAVGFSLKGADGLSYTDGVLDVSSDGWLTVVLSNLPPERNPGQVSPPVPGLLAPILNLQRGLTGVLGLNEYIQLRAKGIAAPRIDRAYGPLIQSGVTTSLTSGQKNINRRRVADFIQDSVARSLLAFSKLPLTQNLKDAAVGEVDAFLNGLLSPNNPSASRINAYEIDSKSGNTPTLEAAGIFVIIIRVRTLSTADFIVIQTEIGEGVVIATAA